MRAAALARTAAGAALAAAMQTGAAAPFAGAAAAAADLRLPAPGSYRLDRIMAAPHGAVLDSEGRARRLAEFTTGKITLFSFMYTACTDARGCPLALAVMHTLKTAIDADPALRGRIRFVSMSFDPAHDTPAVMRSYGGAMARAGPAGETLPWHFLTTQSSRQLAPLLDGFGQDAELAAAATAGQGGDRPALAHLLKLYLIDADGNVREIYSPAWLQPATILGDMRSLLAERPASSTARAWTRWPLRSLR